jgi:hypothetical protein
MTDVIFSADFLDNAWHVLLLLLIPIGGGIPAGVVLASQRGLGWEVMFFLYFISDLVLACVFEPILLSFINASKRSAKISKFREALAKSTQILVSRHGIRPGPFSLIMITFGTDPMTGRAIALAAGHGFLSGWH